MLKRIHREGFTWKDSLFIHGIIVLAFFLLGTVLQSVLMGLFLAISSGLDPDFAQALAFYFPFIMIWVVVILFCLIVKSNRPILSSFWRVIQYRNF